MLKNYLKTSLRFLSKNKIFTIINIAGLAIGTLCCVYIVLYVSDQYSFDRHHQNADNIYRVTTTLGDKGQNKMASCSPPIAPAMQKDFPEVETFTRAVPTLDASDHLLKYKERSFYQNNALFVDSTFFNVFNYRFTNGKSDGSLTGPNSIVLMQPVARKLFGLEDPIGKVITLDDSYGITQLTVTGVIDESLGKSHLQADMFIRMTAGGLGGDVLANTVWSGNNFTYSYIKLRPNADASLLEKKFPAFLNSYASEQLRTSGMHKALHLQPVTSIHTTAGYDAERGQTVSSSFLRILLLIAIFIQAIACINFMNLATARASTRAKEVGVRKVIGAERASLMMQFMSESFLLSLSGVLLALLLLAVALPFLNRITNADIHLASLINYHIWGALGLIVVMTGLVAGSYPALYISSFQPVKVLKGIFTSHVPSVRLRSLLVVFQFVISVILIAGIIVIYEQLEYIKNKDLGFNKNQKLVFSFHTNDTKAKIPLIVDALHQLPEVKGVTVTNNYPGREGWNDWGVFLEGVDPAHATDQQNLSTDENIMNVLGTTLLSGRDLRKGDSGSVIINEALMRKLGLTLQNAPGTKLYTGDTRSYRIAGVMKDFNYRSLYDVIRPFMFIYDPARKDLHNIIVSTASADYRALLQKISSVWRNYLAETPFVYTFLDEEVQNQYESETTMSRIINSFTLMAIFISCLGLFGLAAFSAEQRRKEIGIRKVLGANVGGIVNLLSRDFLRLVVIAIAIATPLSWWSMKKWLQNFAYRIDISWWMFGLAGTTALMIALITVSFQAIKAATSNPVESLRSE